MDCTLRGGCESRCLGCFVGDWPGFLGGFDLFGSSDLRKCMNAIDNFFVALKAAVLAAVEEYQFVRHMQRGGNPDVQPF